MDDRHDISYLKKAIDSILRKIAEKLFPSYKLHFSYVIEFRGPKKTFQLIANPHAEDHKHFILSNDDLEQIITEFTNITKTQKCSLPVLGITIKNHHLIFLLTTKDFS